MDEAALRRRVRSVRRTAATGHEGDGSNVRERPRLSSAALGALPAAARPRERAGAPPGIVHIGLGAFHRAHQAVHTADAGDWGILAVSPRSTGVLEALRAQDHLYAVVDNDGDRRTTRVVNSIVDTAHLATEPDRVAGAIAAPTTRVVTLTVTEKGYRLDPAGALRIDDELRAEAAGGPARTILGALVRGLQRRMAAGAGPIALASCDNLPGNGEKLRSAVRGFCELLPAADARPLLEFVDTAVGFPSSVVDRIVPATTEQDLELVADELGAVDRAAVVAEPYSQWVTTDEFPGGRPDWAAAGVEFTADTTAHELTKLRVLNGSHSALAYLGGLAGHATIAEAVRDEALHGFVRSLQTAEILPTVDGGAIDVHDYARTVLRRFANPALKHRTAQVAADGSQKLPIRLLSVAADNQVAGRPRRRAALVVAAWLRYIALGRDDRGAPLEVSDPLADKVRAADEHDLLSDVDRRLSALDPRLGDDAEFTGLVREHLRDLAAGGARAVAAATGEGAA